MSDVSIPYPQLDRQHTDTHAHPPHFIARPLDVLESVDSAEGAQPQDGFVHMVSASVVLQHDCAQILEDPATSEASSPYLDLFRDSDAIHLI